MENIPVRPFVFAALFFLATCILVLSCGIIYLLRLLSIKFNIIPSKKMGGCAPCKNESRYPRSAHAKVKRLERTHDNHPSKQAKHELQEGHGTVYVTN